MQIEFHFIRIGLPDIGYQRRLHIHSLAINLARKLDVARTFSSALACWFTRIINRNPGIEGNHAGLFWKSPSKSLSQSSLSLLADVFQTSRRLLADFSKSLRMDVTFPGAVAVAVSYKTLNGMHFQRNGFDAER